MTFGGYIFCYFFTIFGNVRNICELISVFNYASTVDSANNRSQHFRNMSKSLKQFMAERRSQKKSESKVEVVNDPYENAYSCKDTKRKPTGFIYYPNLGHKNIWVDEYPECPERALEIRSRLDSLNLINRCVEVPLDTSADVSQLIRKIHGDEMVEKLKSACAKPDRSEAELYDCVFYNGPETIDTAKQAALCCVSLATQIAKQELQNGFAVIRPPGHHASYEPNGYCIFNNVAICAEHLISSGMAKKVLIVDFDVHHGQATQRCFYDRDDVLYFSIHRYEHGTYWPNLKESNSSYTGQGIGKGFNVNVPLNEIGQGDTEYIAITLNILLPLAYEYNPDIILISAGYDACIGCPEGEMKVSPSFYGHLMMLLGGLADGKIACFLEGGYFKPSLAEAVAMTLKALLNDPCESLGINNSIGRTVIDTINDVKFYLRDYWDCFNIENLSDSIPFSENFNHFDEHIVVPKYHGEEAKPPYSFDFYAQVPKNLEELLQAELKYLQSLYSNNKSEILWIYDERLLLHDSIGESVAQEKPQRLKEILCKLEEFGLLNRMKRSSLNKENIEEWIGKLHDSKYLNDILHMNNIPIRHDIYMNQNTPECVRLAAHATLSIAEDICLNNINYGVALIRPPGHHACHNTNSGFCFFNNVAIAANFLTQKHGLRRILIVDFDIHHGDGTQELTYERDDIMYISLHRFDDGSYFPSKRSADYSYVGKGKGFGYNVNVPFNGGKMSNAEYLTVWHKLVLPLAYTYRPEFIIISAGFDAGINDRLGGYEVAPETFGHLVQLLKPVSKVLVVLEGGYNNETTSVSMAMCVKALVGDPLPMPKLEKIRGQCRDSIRNSVGMLKICWPVLQVNKRTVNRIYSEDEMHELAIKVGK